MPDSLKKVGYILVVDDEAAILDVVQRFLHTAGYSVLTAASAVEARPLLQAHHISLVVCDVVMPGQNGYQLAMEIRQQFPGVPIQMISGHERGQLPAPAHLDLSENLITKPFRFSNLLTRIESLLASQAETTEQKRKTSDRRSIDRRTGDRRSNVIVVDFDRRRQNNRTGARRTGARRASAS